MSDRELLDSAAKAAGIPIAWGGPDNDMARRTDTWQTFAPLTDDGDALRLAVKLKVKITPYPLYSEEKHSVMAERRWLAPQDDDDNTYIGPEIIELYGDDPCAATRLAIVRVAAEIGKAMA